eukprot:2456833-Prymnesium_polylepis.1
MLSTLRPQLLHEPPGGRHVFDEGRRLRLGTAAVRDDDRLQGRHHVAPHRRAAANVDVALLLAQQPPERRAVLAQLVLHVDLGGLRAREREPEAAEHARGLGRLQLGLVQVVHVAPPAAKIEPRSTRARLARRRRRLHLLQEGAERRDAGAGADHDDGGRAVARQAEGRFSHKDDGVRAGRERLELRCGGRVRMRDDDGEEDEGIGEQNEWLGVEGGGGRWQSGTWRSVWRSVWRRTWRSAWRSAWRGAWGSARWALAREAPRGVACLLYTSPSPRDAHES